jgi:chemotaxis-related protein WspD
MDELQNIPLLSESALVIDDCWNRIGVRGDHSCPRLKEHVHCHNCEIYAETAKRILDHHELQHLTPKDGQHIAQAQAPTVVSESIIIFRLGDEWLGLPLSVLVEVVPRQAIHSLPHRRSAALLGVSNVRGALIACLSLVDVLGLEAVTVTAERAIPRMLIIGNAAEGHVVCPVDEVDGIYSVPGSLLGASGSGKYTRAIFQWQERSVRLLNDGLLLQTIARNLT